MAAGSAALARIILAIAALLASPATVRSETLYSKASEAEKQEWVTDASGQAYREETQPRPSLMRRASPLPLSSAPTGPQEASLVESNTDASADTPISASDGGSADSAEETPSGEGEVSLQGLSLDQSPEGLNLLEGETVDQGDDDDDESDESNPDEDDEDDEASLLEGGDAVNETELAELTRHVFKEHGAEDAGFITKAAFEEVLEDLYKPEETERAIQLVDANSDQRIDTAEFVKFLKDGPMGESEWSLDDAMLLEDAPEDDGKDDQDSDDGEGDESFVEDEPDDEDDESDDEGEEGESLTQDPEDDEDEAGDDDEEDADGDEENGEQGESLIKESAGATEKQGAGSAEGSAESEPAPSAEEV